MPIFIIFFILLEKFFFCINYSMKMMERFETCVRIFKNVKINKKKYLYLYPRLVERWVEECVMIASTTLRELTVRSASLDTTRTRRSSWLILTSASCVTAELREPLMMGCVTWGPVTRLSPPPWLVSVTARPMSVDQDVTTALQVMNKIIINLQEQSQYKREGFKNKINEIFH